MLSTVSKAVFYQVKSILVSVKYENMSGQNYILQKFDELVNIIEDERAKMKAEVEAYEAEKRRMTAIAVKDDDIINLNVGGTKMTTKRSTLCQVKGSLLASMFSGRWEDSLSRDKDDCVFFDWNPQHFILILEYLRGKTIATPKNPSPLPKIPEDQTKSFQNLVEYLGLSGEIKTAPPEKFDLHSTGVTLQEGGMVAVKGSSSGHQYVLGADVYQQGIVRRKLKLESLQNNNWMLVGVTKGDVVPPNYNSYSWPGSYGWAIGCQSSSIGAWENGTNTCSGDSLVKLARQGDTVELVLDCDTAKLSLHLSSGQQAHINLPKFQIWKLNVNLHGANDKIRIMPA